MGSVVVLVHGTKKKTSEIGLSKLKLRKAVPVFFLVAANSVVTAKMATAQDVEPLVLEPITIDARRVEEILSDIPVSGTVINSESVLDNASKASSELARQVPNYNTTDTDWPRTTPGSLRGVGNLGLPLNPFDTTLSYSLDGQPLSLSAAYPQLLDVERVEVVRGPQNALFGRGGQAGSINYVTRQPDGERDIRLLGEYGSDDTYLSDLYLGGRILDGLAGRLALRFAGQDGTIDAPFIGDDLGDVRTFAARGSLGFDLGEATTLTLRGYFEDDQRAPAALLRRDAPDFPVSGLDEEPRADNTIAQFGAVVRHEFDRFDMTFSLGVQDIVSDSRLDVLDAVVSPGSPFDLPGANINEFHQEERAWSGELKFTSNEGAPTRWIAGVSYYDSQFDQTNTDINAAAPFLDGVSDTRLSLRTVSAFGEIDIPVMPRLTLTPSLRVGRDVFDYDNVFTPPAGPAFSFSESDSRSEVWWAGGLTAEYALSDQGLVYASVRRGHSAGGFPLFNGNAPFGIAQTAYPASTSVTYELGGKFSLMDDSLLLSAAVFHNDVTDGHLFDFDFTRNQFVISPEDYETSGFEIEAYTVFSTDTMLTAGLGYIDADLARGGEVPAVATWSFNLGIEQSWDLDLLGLPELVTAQADLAHVAGRTADIANTFDLDDYTTVNARLAWEAGAATAYLYGRNLTDERIEAAGAVLSGGVEGVVLGRGREIGLGIAWSF